MNFSSNLKNKCANQVISKSGFKKMSLHKYLFPSIANAVRNNSGLIFFERNRNVYHSKWEIPGMIAGAFIFWGL